MSAGDGRPPGPRSRDDDEESLLTRFLNDEEGPLMFVREVLTSMAAVALVGLVLFAVSGVWPPMVAVESGSMDPHMQKGDLIFITEPGRFMPAYTQDGTGVVTLETAQEHDYKTFKEYGSVVIYDNPREGGPPIIHRAMFWVDSGENWYDRANPDYLRGENCEEVPNCPAPHAGFVTKGDNNAYYDQVSDISTVVKPDWVVGVARLRIPYLGWVRLGFSQVLLDGPGPAMVGPSVSDTSDAGEFAAPEPVGVVGAVEAPAQNESATQGPVVHTDPATPRATRRTPLASGGPVPA
jgi:signal peptidase